MAYTLYLYKEFPSKSNKTIRLEIFERDYAGSAIELDALSSTPITLTTDNTNNSVYIPVIKTFLGVNIKDTDQIDYTRLFTPDATKFKVIVKVNGTAEWAGYLTPDSFSQSLQYRSDINLIARDNLGMLSEFTYTSGNTFGTIRNLIDLSLTTIGFQANWEYRVKKVDANGTNVLDGYIPLRAYTGKTYQEVLETLLTGIGCQLRYVGGNKYAIFDIADLKGYGDTITSQDFLFIDQSGMLELIPAWKDITINQDYLLAEEIISNRLAEDDYIFRANRLFNTKIGKQDDPIPQVLIPCYDLLGAGWGGTMAVPSPYDFVGEKPSNILLPIVELPVITAPYIEISNVIPPYNGGLEIQFNVHNAFLAPDEELFSEGILSLTDQLPTNAVNYGGAGIWLYYNVFLESGGKIYDLGNTWQEIASKSAAVARFFKIDKPITEEGEDDVVITGSIDVACNITIMSLLEGGTLSLRLYGYNFYGTFYRRDFFDCMVRISDLKFVLKNDEPGGRTTTATIDANYNLRGDVSLALGEVPASKMNYFSMLGGIYQNLSPYYPPMTGFKRTEAIAYHLSELVGREIAHHYKTQRKKLSGNIINSENFAAMPSFAKPFYDGEKYYALNYGSLDFRNEVMSVELIEVEDYATDDFTFIDAEIDTGGGESLGSGETEFIQWSAAGNAKRIYELDTASEADQAGAFVFIDKSGLSAAKKVPISSLLVDAYTKTESDSRFASIDGDLTQDFSAKKLTTATLLLPQTAPILASGEMAIYGLESGFSGETPSGAGSVTSIALTMPTGFSVSGSPITESGTFGVTFASGYFLPTTTQFASKADVSLIGAANGIAPLDSGGKVALQYLPSTLLKYMGVWDASTNTPTLTSPDTNRKGQVWNVSVAGTQFGIAFKLGDWLIYNDSGVAEKSDNSDDVVSVNGYTGAVTLKTSDIAEQTNLYYTDARVKAYADTLYTPLAHASATNNPHSVTFAQLLSKPTTISGYGIDMDNIAWGYGLENNLIGFTTSNNTSPDGFDYFGILLSGAETANSGAFAMRNSRVYFQTKENNTLQGWIEFWHKNNSGSTSFNWSAAKLTSTTLLLPQTAPSLASGEMAIYGLESGFSGEMPSGAGSVTSISMVVPTGLSVTPTTITESGTFTISYASGYSIPTNTKQSEWDNAYTLRHNAVSLGTANGLSLSTQVLSLGLASTSTNGALSSTDWNTFNGKQAKLIGTGASSLVRVNTFGAITYDDNTYLTGNQTITLSGIITGSGTTAITTAIADGALSIAKTNGLQSALDAKMATASYPDLVAIEALSGTSGLLKKTAADTWTLDTNTYLTAITKEQVEAVLTGTITSHNHDTAYLGIFSKATDSDKLDGHDSTYFQVALTNPVTGTGTSGYLPKFTGASTIGNSRVYNNATGYFKVSNTGDYANLEGDYHEILGRDNLALVIGNDKTSGNGDVLYLRYGNTAPNNTTSKYIDCYDTSGSKFIVYSNGDVLAKSVTLNGSVSGITTATMTENINTNLRIPKVAPTSPTSGQYYFYIVE